MNSLGWKGGTALHSAAEGGATEVSNFKEALQAASTCVEHLRLLIDMTMTMTITLKALHSAAEGANDAVWHHN